MLNSCVRAAAVVMVAIVLLSACGNDSKVDGTKLDESYAPASSVRNAVEQMLTAEAKGDHAASFKLLTPASREEIKDVDAWMKRRAELPVVKSFKLEETDGESQVALVDHDPGLSPFIGLSPGQDRQTWGGKKFTDGWLLDAEPVADPILPSDADATAAAKAWVETVQACDKPKADAMQAVDKLFASVTPTICNVPGPVTAGAPEKLAEGPASTDIVAQYTADSLNWARVVPISSPIQVRVILAPIGNVWKVLGLA